MTFLPFILPVPETTQYYKMIIDEEIRKKKITNQVLM